MVDVSIVRPNQAYDLQCPYCEGRLAWGYVGKGSWWEARCGNNYCREFFHFGVMPVHTPLRANAVEMRCPHPHPDKAGEVCSRKLLHGVLSEDTWFDAACPRCRGVYHFGPYGGGPVAEVGPVGLERLSPSLQGVNVLSCRFEPNSLAFVVKAVKGVVYEAR